MFGKNKNTDPNQPQQISKKKIVGVGAVAAGAVMAAGAALGVGVASLTESARDPFPVVNEGNNPHASFPETPQPTVVPPTTLEAPAEPPVTAVPPTDKIDLPTLR